LDNSEDSFIVDMGSANFGLRILDIPVGSLPFCQQYAFQYVEDHF